MKSNSTKTTRNSYFTENFWIHFWGILFPPSVRAERILQLPYSSISCRSSQNQKDHKQVFSHAEQNLCWLFITLWTTLNSENISWQTDWRDDNVYNYHLGGGNGKFDCLPVDNWHAFSFMLCIWRNIRHACYVRRYLWYQAGGRQPQESTLYELQNLNKSEIWQIQL